MASTVPALRAPNRQRRFTRGFCTHLMNNLNDKQKRHLNYILIGTILWGVFILPVFSTLFMESVALSGELFFISILFSFLATSAPIWWRFSLPPEGKEYYILLYPIFTIPLIIVGIKIREVL